MGKRADLSFVTTPANELTSAFQPLPTRSVGARPEKLPPASEPAGELVSFPSLAPPPKVVMVSKSYRIPLEHIERIQKICKKAGTDESKLVRDFITAGLERIDSAVREK